MCKHDRQAEYYYRYTLLSVTLVTSNDSSYLFRGVFHGQSTCRLMGVRQDTLLTFPSFFLILQVAVLLAASHPGQAEGPELSEEQKEALTQLEKRIGDAISLYDEDGAFIKVNTRWVTALLVHIS